VAVDGQRVTAEDSRVEIEEARSSSGVDAAVVGRDEDRVPSVQNMGHARKILSAAGADVALLARGIDGLDAAAREVRANGAARSSSRST
jgi:hypothetical protein